MLLHRRLSPLPIQRHKLQLHIPIIKKWRTVSMLITFINNSVDRTAIIPSCPQVQQIADVDDEGVGGHGDGCPFACGRVEDLQAGGPCLLEVECYAAEIGVCSRWVEGMSVSCEVKPEEEEAEVEAAEERNRQ